MHEKTISPATGQCVSLCRLVVDEITSVVLVLHMSTAEAKLLGPGAAA